MICKSLTKTMHQLSGTSKGIIHITLDVESKMTLCTFDGDNGEYEFGDNMVIDFCVAKLFQPEREIKLNLKNRVLPCPVHIGIEYHILLIVEFVWYFVRVPEQSLREGVKRHKDASIPTGQA